MIWGKDMSGLWFRVALNDCNMPCLSETFTDSRNFRLLWKELKTTINGEETKVQMQMPVLYDNEPLHLPNSATHSPMSKPIQSKISVGNLPQSLRFPRQLTEQCSGPVFHTLLLSSEMQKICLMSPGTTRQNCRNRGFQRKTRFLAMNTKDVFHIFTITQPPNKPKRAKEL